MHIMRAFIGVNRFQINGMAHDVIFLRNAVATMHIPRGACNIQPLPTLLRFTIDTISGAKRPSSIKSQPASWPDSQGQFHFAYRPVFSGLVGTSV